MVDEWRGRSCGDNGEVSGSGKCKSEISDGSPVCYAVESEVGE